MEGSATFRLFGPVQVIGADGRARELGPRKERAILAMLLLQPRRVLPLDRLIAQLWADEPPASAVSTVQGYISRLRRTLGPRVLVTRDPGYLIDVEPSRVDVTRFGAGADAGRRALAAGDPAEAVRELDAALAEWRGDPLAEFAGEPFAGPTIAHLGNLHAEVVQDRAEARLLLGDVSWCVTELGRLVRDMPYRERLWELLAAALYRAGRPADALAAIRQVRDLLDEELGLTAGPGLRAVEQAILRHDDAAIPGRSAAPVVAAARPVVATALVGRDAELGRIGTALDELIAGDGGLLVLTGEAGIGKTSLARAAADRAAARGATVGWGRCAEDSAAPAYWPWSQALRDAGLQAAALLAGEDDWPQEEELAQFRLHERIIAALAAAAVDRPLTLLLDDLHWADAPSLRLLESLAGQLAGQRILLVTTVRAEPGERGETLRDVLGRLAREPRVQRVAVPAFTVADVGEFLAGRALDRGAATALHERTGGNPFYLGELVRLAETDGAAVPEGVRDVLERRLGRLPENTRTLLRTAAAVGREVPLDVLVRASGTDAERVMQVLEPAVAAGLLLEEESWDYRFPHALVRDALYAGLSRLERARLHLRVGEALDMLGAGGTPEGVARLAHHFGLAARIGGAERAVRYAGLAARHAAAQHAHDRAVEFWEQALAAAGPDRYPVLIELGRARRLTGDTEGAQAVLEEAITAATRAGDTAAVVQAATVFGGVTVWNWRPYGVVDDAMVARLGDLLAGPELTAAQRAGLLGTLGVELYYGPHRAESERYAAEAVELARGAGDTPLLAQTLNNMFISYWVPEHERLRRRLTEEALALPGLARTTELVARIHRMGSLMRAGELAGFDADLARCRRLIGEVRRPELEGVVLMAEATRATLDGRWDECVELAGRYRTAHGRTSLWGRDFCALITLFTARRGQGRLAELIDELVERCDDPAYRPLRPTAVLAAVELGDEDRARDLLERWGTDVPHDWSTDFLLPQWALIAARLGSPDPAGLLARVRPFAGQLIIIGTGAACWGSGHDVVARLAASMGRHDEARTHALAAITVHRRLGLAHLTERSEKLLAEIDARNTGG